MHKLAYIMYTSVALSTVITATPSAMAKTVVYVSAADAGMIDAYSMDETTGALTPISKFETGMKVMPMAISPNQKHLYAVLRAQPYRVLTLAIDPQTGALSQEAVAALPDSMPYVSTDPSGRLLFTSSYGGNKIAVLPINADGKVTDGTRQMILTGQNAHSIVADHSGKYVFATNLGSDVILQFVLNPETGMLEGNVPPKVETKAGSGPRHIVISPDNRNVYVITELTGDVIHYALDQSKGTLSELKTVNSVPAEAHLAPGIAPPPPPAFNAPAASSSPASVADTTPRVWAADIAITPNGKFLYTSERTTSTVGFFKVAEDSGNLSHVAHYPTEKQPRGFRIDPTGKFLIVSGEKSDKIEVFAIDGDTGALSEVGHYPVDAGANWVNIVKLP